MRKRTIRNGMRLIMAAMVLIVLASFYHVQLSDLFSLSSAAESRIYRLGIFWAAAMGGYGVVLTVFGLVLSPARYDAGVRLMPLVIAVSGMVFLFFYLLSSSLDTPVREEQRRVRPGETITI